MAKKTAEKQWLNVVIIVISALILAFTLLGNLMNRAEDSSTENEQQSVQNQPLSAEHDRSMSAKTPSLQLRMIDFGEQKVILGHSKWQLSPNFNLSDRKLAVLVGAWQSLLHQSVNPERKIESVDSLSVQMVQLFFKNSQRPLIAKVELVTDSKGQQKTMISFQSTGQQIIKSRDFFVKLIPNRIEGES